MQSNSFNLNSIIVDNADQKVRIEKLSEASTLVSKDDMVSFLLASENLTLDEKTEILKSVDEWYLSVTEKAILQIQKEQAAQAKAARDEKLHKMGAAAKNVVSKVTTGKDFSLMTIGGTVGSIFKGVTNPFIKGWKDA